MLNNRLYPGLELSCIFISRGTHRRRDGISYLRISHAREKPCSSRVTAFTPVADQASWRLPIAAPMTPLVSIGLNIVLPMEQCPNPHITPELSFQFHYFVVRKMPFLIRAKALVTFPGGFGTLVELFETLPLIRTKKVKPLPVLLFGRDHWQRIIDFEVLMDEGTIAPQDLKLFQYVETAQQAWDIIRMF